MKENNFFNTKLLSNNFSNNLNYVEQLEQHIIGHPRTFLYKTANFSD